MPNTLEFITDDSSINDYSLYTRNVAVDHSAYMQTVTPDGLLERRYLVTGGSDTVNDILADLEDLEEIGHYAREWVRDGMKRYPLWLKEHASGELSKKTLVYDVSLTPVNRGTVDHLFNTNSFFGELTVLTEPYFEIDSSETLTDSSVGMNGDTVSIGSNSGSIDARISEFRTIQTVTMGKFWAGIRNTNYGTADFDPVLDMGAINSGHGTDTSRVVDANALSGNATQTTFATDASLVARQTLNLDDIITATNYEHFVEKYTAVLGYATSATSTTYGIQLKHGYGDLQQLEEVFVTPADTNYHYVELGDVEIPTVAFRSVLTDFEIGEHKFSVLAERLSGAGSLSFDVIILIPKRRQLIFSPSSSATSTAYAIVTENNQTLGYLASGGGIDTTTVNLEHTLSIPPAGGLMVYLGTLDETAKRDKAGTANIRLTYFERWERYNDGI